MDKPDAARVERIQVTVSQGEIRRHGFTWTQGDRWNFRVWLALRLLDPGAAKLYFQTTRGGA